MSSFSSVAQVVGCAASDGVPKQFKTAKQLSLRSAWNGAAALNRKEHRAVSFSKSNKNRERPVQQTRITKWYFPREWSLEQFGVALGLFVEDVKAMPEADRARLRGEISENVFVIKLD